MMSLTALAAENKANPYFLGYALETGAASIAEAFDRDGGNHLFIAWNEERWSEQAREEKVARDFVSAYADAGKRHIALIAKRLGMDP